MNLIRDLSPPSTRRPRACKSLATSSKLDVQCRGAMTSNPTHKIPTAVLKPERLSGYAGNLPRSFDLPFQQGSDNLSPWIPHAGLDLQWPAPWTLCSALDIKGVLCCLLAILQAQGLLKEMRFALVSSMRNLLNSHHNTVKKLSKQHLNHCISCPYSLSRPQLINRNMALESLGNIFISALMTSNESWRQIVKGIDVLKDVGMDQLLFQEFPNRYRK